MLDRPPNSPRASAKPSCNSPRRVRKRSNNCDCYSEKQVDRASGKEFALPGYGGLRRSGRTAVQDKKRFALTQSIIFFRVGSKNYINKPITARSIFRARIDLFAFNSLAFMGAQTDTLQWGQISCSLLYLLRSIGSLEQFGTRSRSSYEPAFWPGSLLFRFFFMIV